MRELAAMGFDEMSREVGVGSGGPPPPRLSLHRTGADHSRDSAARDVLRAMASRTRPAMTVVRLSQRGAQDPSADDYEALLTLDDNNVSRAAAPSDRARYMRRVRPKGPKKICLVCHDEYGPGGGKAVVALPCGHDYHEDCINKWFDREKTCPVCRKELGQR